MILAVVIMLALQPDPAMLRRLFEEELQQRRRENGVSDTRTAQAARDLGLFLTQQHDQPGARAALSEALRIDQELFGAAASQTLADAADLAAVSPPAQAEPLWQRSAASPEARIASRAFAALGELHATAGDRAGAAGLYRRALVREQAAEKDGARVAVVLSALAQLVDLPEGIALLQRALAINRRVLGARHPETATTGANLAGLLLNDGRPAECVVAIRDALPVFEETLGIDHPRVAVASTILAFGLRATGDKPGAERYYRRALAIDEQAYGSKHAQTLDDVRTLAEFLREIGKAREAAALERRLSGAR